MRHLSLSLAACVLALALALPVASSPAPAAAGSSSASSKKPAAKKSTASRGPSPAYRRMRAGWHAAPTPAARKAWLAQEKPPLVIKPVHERRSYEIFPDPVTGEFGEEALAVAREAFQWKGDGTDHPVETRLLDLLYRAAVRYKAPHIHLVSGYRNRDGRATSRHQQGRAADVVVPGVSDAQLAAFFRRQGFVGVGYYPVSGFVHVDIRDRSYSWIDRSGPGQRSREAAFRMQELAQHDKNARRRGEEPTPPYAHPSSQGDEEVLASAETSEED